MPSDNIEKFFRNTFLTEHIRTTPSGFSLKVNFFDRYSSWILMKTLGSTLLRQVKTSFLWRQVFLWIQVFYEVSHPRKVVYSNTKKTPKKSWVGASKIKIAATVAITRRFYTSRFCCTFKNKSKTYHWTLCQSELKVTTLFIEFFVCTKYKKISIFLNCYFQQVYGVKIGTIGNSISSYYTNFSPVLESLSNF